jgi:hypothetical protein
MNISKTLKLDNIAEYLLYMWQVEDIIRVYKFDLDLLDTQYLSQFKLEGAEHEELREWYGNIIEMMLQEGVKETGHIQINKNIIILLNDLHHELLASPKYPFYSTAYYQALPLIVELRSKGCSKAKDELETCFDALYGIMLLRMQGKPISKETEKGIGVISRFVGMLADYYKQDKEKPLEF